MSAESQPAFVRATVCSPSSTHCRWQNYAELYWGEVCSPPRKCAEVAVAFRTIRHSSAFGIDCQIE
jgi:hypothetical protein